MPEPWYFVHSLEHGRIEIQYSPDLPEEDQLALKGVFDERPDGVLLFPNDDMPYEVAVTAWTQLMGCKKYEGAATLDAIRDFRDTYIGPRPRAAPALRPRIAPARRRSAARREPASSRTGRIYGRGGVLKRMVRLRPRYVAAGRWPAWPSPGWPPPPSPRSATCLARSTSSSRWARCGPRAPCRTRSWSGRAGAPASGPVSYRSAVIAAPKRFDLVGLAGEMRPLELRARDDGGAWSDWVETDDGNPVYFGGADELQVRDPRLAPVGPLHYVNVSGTTSAAGGLLTGVREAINSAFISAGSLVDPIAEAAPTRPEIVTRSEWGANLTQGGCPPRERPVLRHGQGRRHPPHRDRQRLQRGGGARDRARHLPLPPQRQRLERHRLQRARRPLRQRLRRARRRA